MPLASSSASLSDSSYHHVPPPVTSTTAPIDSDDSDGEIELTSSQIVQFEEENANILRAVEDMLESVQLAESRLLDISALQTELAEQLVRQTEVVDTLYDEAMTSQNEVERGNVQLRKARERARSSRKWILFFILMATFALLFLHWYD
jgi:syntaxin 18